MDIDATYPDRIDGLHGRLQHEMSIIRHEMSLKISLD